MTTTQIFYKVTRPEFDGPFNNGYQHAYIQVWGLSEYGVIKTETGGLNLSNELELSYQRDNQRHGGEVSHWYGETIERMPNGYRINSDELKKVADLFKKMEKVEEKIRAKGLIVNSGDDALTYRLRLLELVGAKRVDYERGSREYQLAPAGVV